MGLCASQAKLLTAYSLMNSSQAQCVQCSETEIALMNEATEIANNYQNMLTVAYQMTGTVQSNLNVASGEQSDSGRETIYKIKSGDDGYVTLNYNLLKSMGYDISDPKVTADSGKTSVPVEAAKTDTSSLYKYLLDGTLNITKDGKTVSLSEINVIKEVTYTNTIRQYMDFSERDQKIQDAEDYYKSAMADNKAKSTANQIAKENADATYKAAKNMYDSLKKLVDDNVQRSFTLWS